MMIRKATKQDIPELVPFLERCCRDMYSCKQVKHEYDPASIELFLSEHIESPQMIMLVNSERSVINGIIALSYYRSYYNYNELHVCEQAWHSDPELFPYKKARIMLCLLDAALDKVGNDVRSIEIFANPHNDIGSYLAKKGFQKHNISYVKVN